MSIENTFNQSGLDKFKLDFLVTLILYDSKIEIAKLILSNLFPKVEDKFDPIPSIIIYI